MKMFIRIMYCLKFIRLYWTVIWTGIKTVYRLKRIEQTKGQQDFLKAVMDNIGRPPMPEHQPDPKPIPAQNPDGAHEDFCRRVGLNYSGHVPYRLNIKELSDGRPIVGGYSMPDELYEEVVHNLLESPAEKVVYEYGHHFVWSAEWKGWNALHRHSELGIG